MIYLRGLLRVYKSFGSSICRFSAVKQIKSLCRYTVQKFTRENTKQCPCQVKWLENVSSIVSSLSDKLPLKFVQKLQIELVSESCFSLLLSERNFSSKTICIEIKERYNIIYQILRRECFFSDHGFHGLNILPNCIICIELQVCGIIDF